MSSLDSQARPIFLAALERTPANDPAFAARIGARMAALLDRKAAGGTAPQPALTSEPAPILQRAMDDVPAH